MPESRLNDVSRPARARGLKRKQHVSNYTWKVAPRAGAWIETIALFNDLMVDCRAPRGRVD